MTLSAHLTLLLLCILDKESGVCLLRKKTCCVYKCCYRWGCYSDSLVPTGSLGTDKNPGFPLDSGTWGRSELKLARFSSALNSTLIQVSGTKLSCWKRLPHFPYLFFFPKCDTCKTFVTPNVSASLLATSDFML